MGLSTLFYSPSGQPGPWVGSQDQNSGLWDTGDTVRATASFYSNLRHTCPSPSSLQHHQKELPSEGTQPHPEEGSLRGKQEGATG